jgi:hypothetical protein
MIPPACSYYFIFNRRVWLGELFDQLLLLLLEASSCVFTSQIRDLNRNHRARENKSWSVKKLRISSRKYGALNRSIDSKFMENFRSDGDSLLMDGARFARFAHSLTAPCALEIPLARTISCGCNRRNAIRLIKVIAPKMALSSSNPSIPWRSAK